QPPRPDEHEEMVSRVLVLSTAATPPRWASSPDIEAREATWEEVDDAATGVWIPDEPSSEVPSYEEPETRPRVSPIETKTQPFRRIDPRTDPPVRERGASAAPPRVVIDAEPLEYGEPRRPARSASELAAVAEAVLVEETAEPIDLTRPRTTDAPRASGAPSKITGAVEVTAIGLPSPIDPRLTMLADPYSNRADAYRSLCRKLAAAGNPRVIAVTSAGEKEGKTTCAANLALALREGARSPVLLVEANLRAPCLAKLFGFEPPACFDEQLKAFKADPTRPWQVVEPIAPLHVLAVDATRAHAPMLDPAAFGLAMEAIKAAGYEHVVLDTPPVLGGSAVNLVADSVDGIVLTVAGMRTERQALKKAYEQLSPAPILGVVLLERP
ncbi:MAG TPA: CpsD/CapB family tyrosine-protein kinase, partial [Minicystis sp.]|nr:CpsD/CapB family tyrosine-protein kinase [Minicystis sp.]